MALQVRATRGTKLSKLIGMPLLVLALTLQPMYGLVAGQVANAAEPSHSAAVKTEAELLAAAADKTITVIHIRDNIDLNQKIQISGRDVNIKGHGHALTFKNGTAEWDGEYVIQAYNNYITVGSLSISGGDAAIYANGATVRILGSVDVSDNRFGGIEVSQGDGVETPAILNVEVGAVITNTTEENTKPTAWIDDASAVHANTKVNGPFTETTHIGNDQKQYYLNEVKAGVVAVNEDTKETFASLQDAIDDTDTDANDLITLKSDTTTQKQVTVSKSLTIDGSGYTIDGAFSKTSNGNNSVIGVWEDGVTIKNVTVTSSEDTPYPGQLHGINVDSSEGVVLQNVTARDMMGSGILINNGSVADVVNVTTANNGWHGINVDNGSTMNISETVAHDEKSPLPISHFIDGVSVPDIFIDDITDGSVINGADEQYLSGEVEFRGDMARVYTLRSSVALDIKIDGTSVAHDYIRGENGEAVKYSTLVNGKIDLAAILGDDVTDAEFRVRKVTASGNTQSGVFGSHSVQMTKGTDGTWSAQYDTAKAMSVGKTDTEKLDGGYTIQLTATRGSDKVVYFVDLNIDNTKPAMTTGSVTPVEVVDGNYFTNAAMSDDGKLKLTFKTSEELDLSKSRVNIIGIDVRTNQFKEQFKSENFSITYDSNTGEYSALVDLNDPKLAGKDVENALLVVRLQDKAGNGRSWVYNGTPDTYDDTKSSLYFAINNAPAEEAETDDGGETETGTGGPADPEPVDENENPDQIALVQRVGDEEDDPIARFTPAPVFTLAAEGEDEAVDQSVLGAQTERESTAPVLSTTAAVPTAAGWKIFGLMWYWWVLLVAAVAAAWWIIAAARRRSQEDAI